MLYSRLKGYKKVVERIITAAVVVDYRRHLTCLFRGSQMANPDKPLCDRAAVGGKGACRNNPAQCVVTPEVVGENGIKERMIGL